MLITCCYIVLLGNSRWSLNLSLSAIFSGSSQAASPKIWSSERHITWWLRLFGKELIGSAWDALRSATYYWTRWITWLVPKIYKRNRPARWFIIVLIGTVKVIWLFGLLHLQLSGRYSWAESRTPIVLRSDPFVLIDRWELCANTPVNLCFTRSTRRSRLFIINYTTVIHIWSFYSLNERQSNPPFFKSTLLMICWTYWYAVYTPSSEINVN